MEDVFKVIRKPFPYFEIAFINELLEKGVYTIFHAGDTLLKAGQIIRSTLLVMKGSVKI